MFVALSVVGYAGLIWVALAAPVAHFARRNVGASVAFTALCVWTADLLSLAVKLATGRPRPFETVPAADPLIGATVGQSMPSGHAATSFAGAVVLTYLLPRGAPLFFLLAAAIGFSRIYVGVHYPADVLVGAVLGTLVALAWIVVFKLLRPTSAGRRRSAATPPAG